MTIVEFVRVPLVGNLRWYVEVPDDSWDTYETPVTQTTTALRKRLQEEAPGYAQAETGASSRGGDIPLKTDRMTIEDGETPIVHWLELDADQTKVNTTLAGVILDLATETVDPLLRVKLAALRDQTDGSGFDPVDGAAREMEEYEVIS